MNLGPGSLRTIFSVLAEPAIETVMLQSLAHLPHLYPLLPQLSLLLKVKGKCMGKVLRLLSGCYFLNMGHAGAFPKRLGLVYETINK